jgi:hypothetical protein
MRRRLLAVLVAVPAVGLAVVESPRPACGCGVAVPPGGRVDVATETAIIVWDEPARTQHFIRTASFSTTSAEFGFLVPTPTEPELAEASADGFRALEAATAPRTVVEYRNPELGCGAPRSATFDQVGAALPGEVQVLGRQRVGMFEAAKLKADDPKALHRWLADNGYDARPELERWLEVYTDNKWIVTAFKVAADVKEPPAVPGRPAPLSVAGSVVRMSFQTDRPFFPYREPEDQRAAAPDAPHLSRLLRVYFLAGARFDGRLGDGSAGWPGRAVWANRLDRPTVEAAAKAGKLPDGLAGRDWWLTEFEDHSSPRPGTDELYFARSPDQSAVERPPHIQYKYREWPVWAGLTAAVVVPALVVVVIGLAVRRLMRRPS